jgi:hypothetical protein
MIVYDTRRSRMLSKSSTVHLIHVLSIAATTLVTQKIRCIHFLYHEPAYLQGEDCTIHVRNVGKDHFHLAGHCSL